MKEWYEECMDKILQNESNEQKLDGEPKIAEMPHGYFGGTITEISNAIKSASAQYNTIVLEPMEKINEPIIGALLGRNPENPSERGRSNGQYKQRLELNENHTSNTITSVQKDNYIAEPTYRIRKLTERECFRLMGVTDENSDKIRAVVSKSQCYKMAGNSIVVDVLVAIFRQLLIGNKNTYQQLEIF